MKPNHSLFNTLLVTVFFAVGCTPDVPEKPKKKKQVHLVEIAKSVRTNLGVSVTRTGTLKVQREIKIFNQEEGRITELPFYEGDKVTKGTLVARLDDKLLRAQLNRADATLAKSQLDVRRVHNLFKRKLTSEQEVANADTELEVARADKEVIATRLGYTKIFSPITGVVTQRFTEPGNIAERYSHLITIADPTSLITEVMISELLLPELKVGDATQVRIDALGAGQYQGRITRIHPSLDPVSRRGIIEVELKPVPDGARAGQFCRITLDTHAGDRLVIPFRALRRDNEGEYVFVVNDDNKIVHTAVISGLRSGELIEIIPDSTGGLQEGQQVVTRGFLSLKAGKKVKPVQGTAHKKEPAQKPVTPKAHKSSTSTPANSSE